MAKPSIMKLRKKLLLDIKAIIKSKSFETITFEEFYMDYAIKLLWFLYMGVVKKD